MDVILFLIFYVSSWRYYVWEMKNYINQFLEGNNRAFDALYVTFRPRFFAYFSKEEHLAVEEIKELYQQSTVVLFQNLVRGRVVKDGLPDAAIGAYLIRTGNNLLLNKRRKRELPLDYPEDWGRVDRPEQSEDPVEEAKIIAVRTSVRDMPMPCSQMMSLIVFEQKSHAEVAQLMDYASADVVKVTSKRCRDRLRVIIKDRLKMMGYDI